MDSLDSNNTLSFLLLSNGTENVTEMAEDFKKMEAKRKISVASWIVIFVSVFGIIGNAITIPALSKSKKIRCATTAFIVNLSVADFSYCCLTFFNYLVPSLSQNSYYCTLFPVARYWVARESIYTVMAITVNRYVCIAHPSIYRSLYRPLYVFIMILITWLWSLALALAPYYEFWGKYGYSRRLRVCTLLPKNGKSPNDYLFISYFFYPTITFLICYPRIFWIVRKASRNLRSFKTTSSHPHELNVVKETSGKASVKKADISGNVNLNNQNQNDVRLMKVMLVVVFGFIICFFPIALARLFDKKGKHIILWIIAAVAINVSNVINPVIYVVMSSAYRVAYKELFSCKNSFRKLISSGTDVV